MWADAFASLFCVCDCFGYIDIEFLMKMLALRVTVHKTVADDVFGGD